MLFWRSTGCGKGRGARGTPSGGLARALRLLLLAVAFAGSACVDRPGTFSPTDVIPQETRSPAGQDQWSGSILSTLWFDCREFNGWAPPMTYGAWYLIAEHIGTVYYYGEAWADGESAFFGQVRYYGEESWEIEDYVDDFSFTTGDVIATVETRFKGIPYGTAVDGEICY